MELYLQSRMRPYIVHKDELVLYVITAPEYVNISRGTSRFHMEDMFFLSNMYVTCEYSQLLCMCQE